MQEITLSLPCVSRMVSVEKLDSTQNLARTLAQQDAPDGTLVLAYEQTGGRGQFERSWDAKPGGIYFTLLLRPHKAARHSASLSLKTAEAVCNALGKIFEFKTKIKYPNDVLAWDKKNKSWKKLCGILIESSTEADQTQWLLIGVGINVNNKLSPALSSKATSIKKLIGRDMDPEWILQEVLEAFWEKYAQWILSSQI